ncbi:helix-turn-helix domain-containing protein [Streptomyces coelicoflavus]|uniref:Helix-turn-helix domain-containing protein n=1 Tax=Streptomyces coelicoflavus TaxID=285562 RepID=A0A6N9ULY7_9ACTN|nr:helix-turn-helix domain-containing protein [Streptomyces sp. SID5477]NEB18737.1 helix-turn-helix domain-containing protein [Streptomyces coelicoflavus]
MGDRATASPGRDSGPATPAPHGVTSAAFGALPPSAGGQGLATVLSSLQRASGLSLRALANRSDLSASFLSRLMTGERFPSWKNVAAIARVVLFTSSDSRCAQPREAPCPGGGRCSEEREAPRRRSCRPHGSRC